MNSVTLIGNLGRDPEIRTTKNGAKMATLAVATTSFFNKEKVTEWHQVVAWGGHAEAVGSLKKGDAVVIVGEIRTRKWDDQKGDTRYTTEIIVAGFNGAISHRLFVAPKDDKAQKSTNGVYKRYDQAKEASEDLNDAVPF